MFYSLIFGTFIDTNKLGESLANGGMKALNKIAGNTAKEVGEKAPGFLKGLLPGKPETKRTTKANLLQNLVSKEETAFLKAQGYTETNNPNIPKASANSFTDPTNGQKYCKTQPSFRQLNATQQFKRITTYNKTACDSLLQEAQKIRTLESSHKAQKRNNTADGWQKSVVDILGKTVGNAVKEGVKQSTGNDWGGKIARNTSKQVINGAVGSIKSSMGKKYINRSGKDVAYALKNNQLNMRKIVKLIHKAEESLTKATYIRASGATKGSKEARQYEGSVITAYKSAQNASDLIYITHKRITGQNPAHPPLKLDPRKFGVDPKKLDSYNRGRDRKMSQL